ncbi:hypothetical protein BDR22DRAFT_230520 [Usnea florida]
MDTNAPKEKEAPKTHVLQNRERPSVPPSKEILVYDLAEQDVSVRMAKDIDLNHCRQIPDLPRGNRFWIFIDAKNELTKASTNADARTHPTILEVNLEKLSRRHHMLRFLGQLSTLYLLMEGPGNETWSSDTYISPSPQILVYDDATQTLNVQSAQDTDLNDCQILDLPPKQDRIAIFVDPETEFRVTTASTGASGRCNIEIATLYLDKLDRRDRKLRSRGQLSKLYVFLEELGSQVSSSHT